MSSDARSILRAFVPAHFRSAVAKNYKWPKHRYRRLAKRYRQMRRRYWHWRAHVYYRLRAKSFLRDFYAASREVGVRPFLMWGTLLGYQREGRVLKHDGDIDLGMLASDYAKKDALVAAMRKRGYVVAFDADYKVRFKRPHRSLWIDLDIFYPWRDQMICTFRQPDGALIGGTFPPAPFAGLREAIFCGDISVFIPDPPETVLASIYGDWRTPNPDYDSRSGPINRLYIAPGDPAPQFPTTPPPTPASDL